MEDNTQAKKLLQFQLHRETRTLFKKSLSLIEDLRLDHEAMMDKIENNIPKEYHSVIEALNYFNEQKFQHLRKRILDSGNDCLRGIEEQMEQFNVTF